VFNASEMVAQIREVEALGKDLFVVVGKVPVPPALAAGMAEWGECPELGPIGDLLSSRDFQTTAVCRWRCRRSWDWAAMACGAAATARSDPQE
jgi:hypothetical protein